MNSLSFTFQTLITSNHDSICYSNIQFRSSIIGCANAGSVGVKFRLKNRGLRRDPARSSVSNSWSGEEVEGTVEEVMIPKEWMNPSKAAEVVTFCYIYQILVLHCIKFQCIFVE